MTSSSVLGTASEMSATDLLVVAAVVASFLPRLPRDWPVKGSKLVVIAVLVRLVVGTVLFDTDFGRDFPLADCFAVDIFCGCSFTSAMALKDPFLSMARELLTSCCWCGSAIELTE